MFLRTTALCLWKRNTSQDSFAHIRKTRKIKINDKIGITDIAKPATKIPQFHSLAGLLYLCNGLIPKGIWTLVEHYSGIGIDGYVGCDLAAVQGTRVRELRTVVAFGRTGAPGERQEDPASRSDEQIGITLNSSSHKRFFIRILFIILSVSVLSFCLSLDSMMEYINRRTAILEKRNKERMMRRAKARVRHSTTRRRDSTPNTCSSSQIQG